MAGPRPLELKSADRLAFEHYLRSGERLTANEWLARQQRKFNPYHDELGRFTFGPGGPGSGAAARSDSTKTPGSAGVAPPKPLPKQPVNRPRPSSSGRPLPRRIGEIPGFPDTGQTAWRASNDYAFEAAANFYNRKYRLKPNDPDYKTPEFMKAWAMRESGGEGDRGAFLSDPFQVNNPGDWDDKKATILGLRKGQRMTPASSAYAALEWLRDKSIIQDGSGKVIRRLSQFEALQHYNGVSKVTKQSGSLQHKVWYASTILQLAKRTQVTRK